VYTARFKRKQVAVCASLLARYGSEQEQHRSFISRIVVNGVEKLCLYGNMKNEPQQKKPPRLNVNVRRQNKILTICWDKDNVVSWKLLPKNLTMTADVYFYFNLPSNHASLFT